MSIDITNLTSRLRTSILNLTDATKEDILLLSNAVNSVTTDRIVSVATVSDLPDLETYPIGSGIILYIDSIDVLVISCKKKWIGLDGRLLRNDASQTAALSWGGGNYGLLGVNTANINSSSPVTVVGGVTDWAQISIGTFGHALGVTDSGIAYAWGYGSSGKLGNNSTLNRSSPVTVVGGITDWAQVAAGQSHSVGITTSGIAYAWGSGGFGRLGTNNTSNRSSPVTVAGNITSWSQISVGSDVSIGLAKGIAYVWGDGSLGAMGDGFAITRSSPVTVIGGFSWAQVSAGGYTCHGITGDGVLYGWGDNRSGQVGNNSNTNRSSPVTVVGGLTWTQVSSSSYHTLGIATGGTLYAWGSNGQGRLGDGTIANRSSPVTVVGGITNWSKISAGYDNSAGLTAAGTAYVWGKGSYGANGDLTTINRSSPVTVVGGITTWTSIESNRFATMAIRTTT